MDTNMDSFHNNVSTRVNEFNVVIVTMTKDKMSNSDTVGASAANNNLIELKNNFYPCLE